MIAPDHPLFVDLAQITTGDPCISLDQAFAALAQVHTALDARLRATTGNDALPCHEPRDGCATCARCCHESVFLTPLEWLYVVRHMQTHFSEAQLTLTVQKAHALYAEHRATIDAFMQPPPAGERDHFVLARDLKFACPLLDANGCSVYPAREILGRVFGQAFNDEGGIYGCTLSGAYFGGSERTLVKASAWAKRIDVLPLTGFRQVYPWYFAQTYDLANASDQG